MRKRRVLAQLTLTLVAVAAGGLVVHAGDGQKWKGVIELFTSQGCSSCPPADNALQRFVQQGDVVALAYHVDYWNYRGWTDTLGSKENTDRQYAYARMLGRSGVYTPQAVLNGREHINGADYQGIANRLNQMDEAGKGLAIPIEAAIRGDEIDIKVGAGSGKANIVVVYFDKEQSVDVEKGENLGKKITYWHAVRDIQTIGMWEGTETKLVLPASMLGTKKAGGCAILLQRMRSADVPAAIIGATVVTPRL